MGGIGPGIHVLLYGRQSRGWHRTSGLPEVRTLIKRRKSGKPRLAVTSTTMTQRLAGGLPFAMFRTRDRVRNEGARPRMSRASVAERTKLSVFLARGLFRSLIGRVATHPIVSWLRSFGKVDRLVIAPQDLRTTDATR